MNDEQLESARSVCLNATFVSDAVKLAKSEIRERFKDKSWFVGVGIGRNSIRLYVNDRSAIKDIPLKYAGLWIEIVESGAITPQE